MNILICGGNSGLCRQLADRLSREHAEIYYVSGNTSDGSLSKSVFQEYHFDYLSESINEIVTGAHPEIMIVAGAWDTNFSWRHAGADATRYVTSMTSLFMAAQNAGVRRILYISATDIFENNTEEVLTDETIPLPSSIRCQALYRTEKILSEFRENKEKDAGDIGREVTILRLPLVFGEYEENSTDILLSSAVSYIQQGRVSIISKRKHTAMYFGDAAEAAIRAALMPSEKLSGLYQLRGIVFTEEEMAEAILKTGWNKTAFIDRTGDLEAVIEAVNDCPPMRISDADEAKLSFRLRYNLEEAIRLLCKACLKHHKAQERKERNSIQVIPIIESMILAYLTYRATIWISDTWVGDNLNLFIIYVLVLAVSYGTSHGLFASILSGLGLFLIMTSSSSVLEVASGYDFYLQFLELILIGVIAGYVRDAFKRKNNNLTEDKKYLTTEVNDLTRINENNIYVKDIYEKRLVGYENSLSHIYELTTALDFMESQKVTFQAVHMISDLMSMKDVAVYTAGRNTAYLRLAAATSEQAEVCGKSLKFDESSFLYEKLHGKEIYINRELEENRPAFGGAVYSDDQMLCIILVWTKDLRQINLYTSDMLAIACRLIEKSMARAFLYEESLRNDNYVGDTNIMKTPAFVAMLEIFDDGFKQGLLHFTTLKVLLNGHTQEEAARLVRNTDYIGILNGVPCLILSNTTAEDAGFVQRRFLSKGMEAVIVESEILMKEAENCLEVSQ